MRISDWSSDVCSSDLFPRLPELRRQHPELHIDLDTLSHAEARLGEGIDAAIALARSIDPALYAARLDQDKIFPIAARSEENTSELQSLMRSSYAVFCLKKKKHTAHTTLVHYHTYHTTNKFHL